MKRTLLGLGCIVVLAAALSPISYAKDRPAERRFTRVGTFANFRNAGLGTLTVWEIITSTPDGRTLIYTDAEAGAIGFIDITGRLQAVSDSFYTPTTIFDIDTTTTPAVMARALTVGAPCTTAVGCFDPEGLAYAPNGDLWIASEGNADDTRPNRLIQVNPATGAVLRTVGLPANVLACRAAERAKTSASTRATGSHGSGFEGLDIVATTGGGYLIYAAQQRGWNYATTPAT